MSTIDENVAMKAQSVTEDSVGALVTCFYEKICQDRVLAPIFNDALGDECWDGHIATMREFWCSALHVKRGYAGDMLAAHQKLGKLDRAFFPRWLGLFEAAALECFAEAPARMLFERATRIARNLESALSHARHSAPPTALF